MQSDAICYTQAMPAKDTTTWSHPILPPSPSWTAHWRRSSASRNSMRTCSPRGISSSNTAHRQYNSWTRLYAREMTIGMLLQKFRGSMKRPSKRSTKLWLFGSSVYSPGPLSPMRSEEFDYQQSNITLLKAQLKLVTYERDIHKKDVKRISQERDGAYRHLSLSASPQSSLETSSHHRTNSDTAPTIAKSGNPVAASQVSNTPSK